MYFAISTTVFNYRDLLYKNKIEGVTRMRGVYQLIAPSPRKAFEVHNLDLIGYPKVRGFITDLTDAITKSKMMNLDTSKEAALKNVELFKFSNTPFTTAFCLSFSGKYGINVTFTDEMEGLINGLSMT